MTKRVLKVVGVFSGAEAFGILCSVVKMKLVAVWLSAVGVGLFGIFNTTIDTISIITGLGLRQSGVREIAKYSKGRGLLRQVVARLRGWCLLSGILGALIISLFAPGLSIWFFGSIDNWWQFVLLSGALLMNSLIGGEQAILQGTEFFKRLAKASVYGSALGLAISIPMFRWLGDISVPLSILAYSSSILFSLYVNRNKTLCYCLPNKEEMKKGSEFVKLGGYLALATFATNLAQMIFMSWLNKEASTSEVGYYQAGNTLVFRYTSIIFSAIGLEFYPRMAANSHSTKRMSLFVSHEISLLLKIFTPMLILFLLFRRLIVQILYTAEFDIILPFISVAIFTIILRAISTCMAFSIIAKGDGKTYLFTESLDAVIGVCLNIWLYSVYGLFGIGIAQVIWYALYAFMIAILYYYHYGLRISKNSLLMIIISLIVSCLLGFLIVFYA